MPLASEGPVYSVQGVDDTDMLYMRASPGSKSAVVGQIPPHATGVQGTGARQDIGPGVWREVVYKGVQGWVNARFLVEERR